MKASSTLSSSKEKQKESSSQYIMR